MKVIGLFRVLDRLLRRLADFLNAAGADARLGLLHQVVLLERLVKVGLSLHLSLCVAVVALVRVLARRVLV